MNTINIQKETQNAISNTKRIHLEKQQAVLNPNNLSIWTYGTEDGLPTRWTFLFAADKQWMQIKVNGKWIDWDEYQKLDSTKDINRRYKKALSLQDFIF